MPTTRKMGAGLPRKPRTPHKLPMGIFPLNLFKCLSFFCMVCVHAYVNVCAYLSVSMCVQMHMCASRGQPGLLLNSAHLAFLRWFFIGLGLSRLGRPVNEPQNPCLCPPPSAETASVHYSLQLFTYGFWGPNSGLHACTASTLPTEAPPQSPPFSSISNLLTLRPFLRTAKA